MREIGNDKARTPNLGDDLVIDLIDMLFLIDAACFIAGVFNRRLDAVSPCRCHSVVKPHRYEGL